MTDQNHYVQKLQELEDRVAEMTNRMEELSLENETLRQVCAANGIQYKDVLAAKRHRRYFMGLCDAHPIEDAETASVVLPCPEIAQRVAEVSNCILNLCFVSRCVFMACKQLAVKFPWKFGLGRLMATLEGHAMRRTRPARTVAPR